MHGNEPVLLALIVWLALVAFSAVRSFAFWTRPGPARAFRAAYFFAAIPWLVIWAPALITSATIWIIGKYPLPTLKQLVERFGGNVFDVGLGVYALIVPILLPAAMSFAVRARNSGNVS